ncbi:MAG: hypothetical protein AB1478_01255 [Nitrospirota bacterium]
MTALLTLRTLWTRLAGRAEDYDAVSQGKPFSSYLPPNILRKFLKLVG